MSVVGDIAKGLMPGVGSGLNMQFSLMQQRMQNQYNREQIREQNDYNSPLATKNRMIAAGISPKAAENAIAGVPTLGAQSSVATSAPYQGEQPFTNYSNLESSNFANDLLSAQSQQTQAATQLDFARFQNESKTVSANMMKTIAETKNIDEDTFTKMLNNYFRHATVDYDIQLIANEYLKSWADTAGYAAMTPRERAEFTKNNKNKVIGQESHDAQRATFAAKNAYRENQVDIARWDAQFEGFNFQTKEFKEKIRLLDKTFLAVERELDYNAAYFGWSTEQIDHERKRAREFFQNYDAMQDAQYWTLMNEKNRAIWMYDNPWIYKAQTAVGFGASALNAGLQIYSVTHGKPPRNLYTPSSTSSFSF